MLHTLWVRRLTFKLSTTPRGAVCERLRIEVSTQELMTDAMLAFELAPGQHGLTWPDLPRDASTLANASEASGAVTEGRLRSPFLST